jgi:hypothetical protein
MMPELLEWSDRPAACSQNHQRNNSKPQHWCADCYLFAARLFELCHGHRRANPTDTPTTPAM